MDDPALVITGFGITTALGRGADANWAALVGGQSGLRDLETLDVRDYPVQRGGEAPPLPGVEPIADRRDRAHAYLRDACRQALDQAGIAGDVPAPRRAALILGSSLAAQASATEFWDGWLARGPGGADFTQLKSYDIELRIADLCAAFDVQGEALLVSNACAAGASALAMAADLIRLDRADLVIAAGFDALDLHTFSGFGGIKALAADTVRPFARERAGMQLGDGFAALVLERAESARAAGRAAQARLLGWGESADAHHLTQPDPQGRGAAAAMQAALARAGLTPEAVEYINVHSTATPSNDAAEASGMRAVFGERLATIPLGASKPAVGHTLGGAGAVEAVLTLLTMQRAVLPPVLHAGEVRDPACGALDLVAEARPAEVRVAMSNSFGFGGCNTSLLFGRAEEVAGRASTAPARVFVRGVGVVAPPVAGGSPVDAGGAALWERVQAGSSALNPAPTQRAELNLPPACAFARDFAAEKHLKLRAIRKAANTSRMAVVAAHLALQDAGLDPSEAAASTSVILGTTFGCSAYYLKFHQAVLEKGPKGANAVLFTESVFNAAAGHVSMAFGLRGASLVVAGGEESGLSAVVAATDRLRLGAVEVAITGGVDEYSDLVHASLRSEARVGVALEGLGATTPGPYAEGAALFVLHTQPAGAQAELLGVGRARPGRSEAASDTLERAARAACATGGIAPDAVDLYVGGGSGGARSAAELGALDRLAAQAASAPRVVSPQQVLGEGFGFTSAALLAIGTQALQREPTVRRVLVVSSSATGAAAAVLLGRVRD